MKKILLSVLVVILVCSLCFSFVGCDEAESDPAAQTAEPATEPPADPPRFGIRNESDPIVAFTFSTGDVIRVELYPDVAPISVENFLKYVEDGFYVGVAFHRIIKGFMIQTGGFQAYQGYYVQKTATYPAIKGEFAANGVENDISHKAGVISMARTTDPNSATTQFFLCAVDYPSLDGQYAAFGCVIDEESMAVIKKFEEAATSQQPLFYGDTGYYSNDVPNEMIVITEVTRVR